MKPRLTVYKGPHMHFSGRKMRYQTGTGKSVRFRLSASDDPRKLKRAFRRGRKAAGVSGIRINPSDRARIVYNKLLGGWYVVRGPHQTPLSGRFPSKEAAQNYLQGAGREFRPDYSRNPVLTEPNHGGKVGDRVQISPAFDAWMRGDRYGVIEKITPKTTWVRLDKSKRVLKIPHYRASGIYEIIEADRTMRENPAGFTQGPRPRKLARSRMAREIIVLSGKRSGHVFAYATLETSKAELLAEASRIARARGEPIKVQRVSAATLARIAPKIPGAVQRYVSNPAPRSDAVERAARRFSRFTGHRAERVEMLPFPSKPKAGLAVGPVLVLAYRATRDGKTENYMHKFAPHARPMLVASDDGSALYLVGGRYRFTERGIVDAKK